MLTEQQKLFRQEQMRQRVADQQERKVVADEDRKFGRRYRRRKIAIEYGYSLFADHARDFSLGPRPRVEPRLAPDRTYGATRYGRFESVILIQ